MYNVITQGKYKILKRSENVKRVVQNVLVILVTGIAMD